MNRYLFILFFTINFALSPLLVNAANAIVQADRPKTKYLASVAAAKAPSKETVQTPAPESNGKIEDETDEEVAFELQFNEEDNESSEDSAAKVTPFPEQPKPIARSPKQSPKGSSRRPSLSLLVTTPSEKNKELVESKTDRKKAPLGATWWCGTRRGRIKHAFETYPDSPRSNTYREELRGLQEIEQDATERSLVLKASRPELITTDNIDRKILDRIINGCTTLDVALNPTVFSQIWAVSKQLKDQQINYVDTHSLALIQDCLEKLADFMGHRNPLIADITKSQRAANALCKGVNHDPENESDDEDAPWGPEEIFNCSKMKMPVSIKIPGSEDTLELLVTFKKAQKPVVEQSALEFKEQAV